MREPRSEIVREMIRRLAFTRDNREYMRDLLQIERFALHAPRLLAEGMLDESLRARYPREYMAILKELAPADYACRQREDARRVRRARDERVAERLRAARERERDRRMWAAVTTATR